MTALVGCTPLVRLRKPPRSCLARVVLKLEGQGPFKSVKDRVARAMVDEAEARGLARPGRTTLVEATSGNTGVSLAFVAAARGYDLIVAMPEDASRERRALLLALGARVELTPAGAGMAAPVRRARAIAASLPDAHVLRQFENPANPAVHYATTGPEIWVGAEGRVDAFVAGVGTGGTVSGAGRYLREKNPNVEIVAVEPAESPVLSGGRPGHHLIEGIGAGFVPPVLDRSALSEVIRIPSAQAVRTARELATKEGLLVGISSGATVAAAFKLAARPEYAGKTIVAVAASAGERYLTTPLFGDLWGVDATQEEKLPDLWKRETGLAERGEEL